MVHIIKVYLQDQNNEQQIRRLAVSSEIVGNFNLLAWKIRELFPAIRSESFDVTWKDSENDVIHMSSDEELAQALANAEEGLLRIYVKVPYGSNPKEQEVPKANISSGEKHPLVVCDGCDKEVYGCRYKCLQCSNYDLCSTCNSADKHSEHDMIKLVRPVMVHRNWVFLGARKMWRSMFGRCSGNFHDFCKNQKGSSSPESEKTQEGKSQWKTVVDDLLKGDYIPAEKLVKENLGHFLNFVESFGDVDVRIEKHPFGDVNKQSKNENCTENKEKSSSKTKQAESSTIPESPVVHNIEQATDEKTKLLHANTDSALIANISENANETIASASDCAVASNTTAPLKKDFSPTANISENANETMSSTSDCAAVSNITAPFKKDSSPTGLFSDFETSVNVDGWTLVHDNEVDKRESSVPMMSESTVGVIPKVNSMYPDITKTVESGEISPEQVNVAETQNVTLPKETVTVSQDPEIINALFKMQAMGFTNEGGWLERLLITKNGNINAALDALYPNARRS